MWTPRLCWSFDRSPPSRVHRTFFQFLQISSRQCLFCTPSAPRWFSITIYLFTRLSRCSSVKRQFCRMGVILLPEFVSHCPEVCRDKDFKESKAWQSELSWFCTSWNSAGADFRPDVNACAMLQASLDNIITSPIDSWNDIAISVFIEIKTVYVGRWMVLEKTVFCSWGEWWSSAAGYTRLALTTVQGCQYERFYKEKKEPPFNYILLISLNYHSHHDGCPGSISIGALFPPS